jgi:Ca2+-binding RTX toxin-like protein
MPITITVDHSSAPIEVRSDMFGVNLLSSTNEVDGVPNERYVDAIDLVGATRLRYPAGRAANEQITELNRTESGFDQLREDFRNYLDWVKETDSRTTLVIPALSDAHTNQQSLQDWAELVLEYMGDQASLIAGYEIGNEFWQTIEETEYGSHALDIASALRAVTVDGYQPDIWVQTANVAGGASNYKGASNGSINDADAIAAMQHWDATHRPDDWSDGQTAEQYYRSLNGWEQRVIKGNLEIIEQLDADHNITNGFQNNTANSGIDGIVAHYYFDKELDGYDQSADLTRSELKALDLRFATWEAMIPQDLSIQVTEWNVETGHWHWLGLKAAGVVVEQFQNMVEMGVDGADFWTVRHNTSTAIAGGNSDAGTVELTPAGVMLALMTESLNPDDGAMYAISVSGFDAAEMEVNAYSNGYRSVVYVTSHMNEFDHNFSLDLSDLGGTAKSWSARVVGMDASSSDGLSDNAAYDESGDLVSRTPKRSIDEDERQELIDVLGAAFDNSLIKMSSGQWKTYLPKPEDIFVRPGISTPTELRDFYFATETDVSGSLSTLTQAELGTTISDLSVRLNPYEVIEITIEHAQVIYGNSSGDLLTGGSGEDALYGEGGDDSLRGFEGQDILIGGTGHDVLYGGDGNDRLEGKAGNDRIFGGAGNDKLIGGDGNDYLQDDDGNDDFVGGNGEDTVSYADLSSGVFVNLATGENSSGDTFNSIEHLIGSSSSGDILYGNELQNRLNGGGGNDRLFGGAGNDTLFGGNNEDQLYGGSGHDLLRGGGQNDEIHGGLGNDCLFGDRGNDEMFGGNGNDFLYGGYEHDLIRGGGNADELHGELGTDTLFGDRGNDRLFGGNNEDQLFGGHDHDLLRGGANRDTLQGELGDDTLHGDRGNDRVLGGNGNDHVYGDFDHDFVHGGAGSDMVNGGSGNDTLGGGIGDDIFVFAGNFGHDWVTDFETTNDAERIDLAGVNTIIDFTDLLDNHIIQVDDDVVIDDLTGNTITISNVDLSDLSANDFIF